MEGRNKGMEMPIFYNRISRYRYPVESTTAVNLKPPGREESRTASSWPAALGIATTAFVGAGQPSVASTMRMMRRLSSKSSSKRASRRASRDDSTADDRLRLDQGFDSSRGDEAEEHTNQAAARASDDDMDEDELESYLSSLEETTAPSAAYSPPSVRPPTHSSTEAGAVPSLLSPSEGYGYFSLSPARPELRNVRGRASPLMRPSSSVQRGTTSTSMTGALNTKLAAHLRGLRQHFEQADEQGSGLVDLPGFQAAVRAMGVAASDARCAAAFLELDFDRSGTISYDEYVRFALREALSASFGKVVDLFRKWDADGDGHVSKAELQRACDEIGFDAPTEDLDALFEQYFNADGSGKVAYTAMQQLLQKRPPPAAAAGTSTSRTDSGRQSGTARRESAKRTDVLEKAAAMLGGSAAPAVTKAAVTTTPAITPARRNSGAPSPVPVPVQHLSTSDQQAHTAMEQLRADAEARLVRSRERAEHHAKRAAELEARAAEARAALAEAAERAKAAEAQAQAEAAERAKAVALEAQVSAQEQTLQASAHTCMEVGRLVSRDVSRDVSGDVSGDVSRDQLDANSEIVAFYDANQGLTATAEKLAADELATAAADPAVAVGTDTVVGGSWRQGDRSASTAHAAPPPVEAAQEQLPAQGKRAAWTRASPTPSEGWDKALTTSGGSNTGAAGRVQSAVNEWGRAIGGGLDTLSDSAAAKAWHATPGARTVAASAAAAEAAAASRSLDAAPQPTTAASPAAREASPRAEAPVAHEGLAQGPAQGSSSTPAPDPLRRSSRRGTSQSASGAAEASAERTTSQLARGDPPSSEVSAARAQPPSSEVSAARAQPLSVAPPADLGDVLLGFASKVLCGFCVGRAD